MDRDGLYPRRATYRPTGSELDPARTHVGHARCRKSWKMKNDRRLAFWLLDLAYFKCAFILGHTIFQTLT